MIIRPLLRSLPDTRSPHRDGVSLAFLRAHLRDLSNSAPSDGYHAGQERSGRPLRPGIQVHPDHSSVPARDQNHGLNTHASSAVPFNVLFPHS